MEASFITIATTKQPLLRYMYMHIYLQDPGIGYIYKYVLNTLTLIDFQTELYALFNIHF